ncbi:hypothetical protein An13g03460 [Aspergillus niger]|uniref:Uncharacterized protein n=2 Tax=Aspergillus niger TaxID=5061 RepID=A2R242_ASPNC|nr:hypothetical protein An13g03460 [Aspergillus niger]CAK41742.1 hypothetical protein An13g03460 [Aspergillus niger]
MNTGAATVLAADYRYYHGRGSDKVCLRRACAVNNEVIQPTWELSTKEFESLVWTGRFRYASALPTTAGLFVSALVAAWAGPQRQVSESDKPSSFHLHRESCAANFEDVITDSPFTLLADKQQEVALVHPDCPNISTQEVR